MMDFDVQRIKRLSLGTTIANAWWCSEIKPWQTVLGSTTFKWWCTKRCVAYETHLWSGANLCPCDTSARCLWRRWKRNWNTKWKKKKWIAVILFQLPHKMDTSRRSRNIDQNAENFCGKQMNSCFEIMFSVSKRNCSSLLTYELSGHSREQKSYFWG